MRYILCIILCLLPLSARPSDSISVSPDIIHTYWISHSERIFRRVDIYLPAEYDTCTQALPVLYLLHGINGYEGSWQDKGSAVDTLASLIAQKRCPPMILVMPDCNKWPFKKRPVDHGNLWKCVLRYSRLSREHQLEEAISDLIDMIDTTYCVSDCAVAGLSDGGRISANVANRRPDRICAVGLFSPVLHKDQMPKYTTQMYSIYVGKQDFLRASGKRYHRYLTKQNFPHRYYQPDGKHDWNMWRRCLSNFLEQLSDNPYDY